MSITKQQQQQQIGCIVGDCYYYAKGNRCQADNILVTTNSFAENSNEADMDFEMASELSPQEAGASSKTSCLTYKPRNASNLPIGGA